MNEFPELRAALVSAAERQRTLVGSNASGAVTGSAGSGLAAGHRPWWRLQARALVIAVVVLLVVAAAALAAVGVFSPGRPVTPVSAPSPRVANGAVIASTVRLLGVRAADLDGGPSWGLRTVRTTRGEVCIAPGLVQDAQIGVLGRDQAFGDDGRLHPFAPDYIDPTGCALPDGRGHAFLSIRLTGLPASALIPGAGAGSGGCHTDNPAPANHALLCSPGELRDVSYGLLGPDAVSISYRSASRRLITERTAGPDGAYLVVLPYTSGLEGNGTIATGLAGGPILTVRYRHGTCSPRDHACSPVGYVAPRHAVVTAAQVRAPISARVVPAHAYCQGRNSVVPCNGRIPHGFSRIRGAPFVLVDINFTARLPVTNSHTDYQLDLTYAKSPGCTVGGVSDPTNTDIRAGQRINMQDFHLLSCPGPVHGSIRYVQANTLTPPLPGAPRSSSILVGRFVVNPTASQHPSP